MIDNKDSQTSSVGAVWPPEESSNNRIKGFYGDSVNTIDDLEIFASEFRKYRDEVNIANSLSDRLSIRVLANVAIIESLDLLGANVEAAMPLRDNDSHMVVYTAWNDVARRTMDDKLKQHFDLLDSTIQMPVDRLGGIDRLTDQGLIPRYINEKTTDKQKRSMVGQFTDLYGAFGYDESDVEELLLNPANTIAYVNDGSRVISTAMAEHASVSIDGHGQIAIAEITEAVTLPEYRQRGLYRSISGFLIQKLLAEGEPLDVIYGESNLAMPGVVIAAHQNGRRFSYLDRDALDVSNPAFGILQQNFKIDDGVENRPYNDFALSYVPLG